MTTRPHGRNIADFGTLSPAENQLLEACRTGTLASIADKRPSEESPNNRVRAGLIRFLALGGDDRHPVHELGVQLRGAWIVDTLDLQNCARVSGLRLLRCHFVHAPVAQGAHFTSRLVLNGCHCPGLNFDGARIEGDVFLGDGFTANGKVRLLGAQIGGNLECSKAQLDGQQGDALSFDGAKIQGSVFLNNGFTAKGKVRLLGAQIGDSLMCSKAQLDGQQGEALNFDRANIQGSVFLNDGFTAKGKVRLLGAQIGGDLNCSKAQLDGQQGEALSCERAQIAGRFFFRNLKAVKGVHLSSAQVGVLVDDANAWGGDVALDGFVYGHLGGTAPTDAAFRLKWLAQQTGEFRPQPWRQLRKVLREMGHADVSRRVGIAFEEKKRQADGWSLPRRCLHWLYGGLIGYGYRPLLLCKWMGFVWLLCAAIYWWAALQGIMGPSNPLVFQNPKLETCQANWYLCKELPEEYTGFSPLMYSLDVLLPVISLQQENDWAPLIPTPVKPWYQELGSFTCKHLVRLVLWFEILFGWVASLLMVAVLSGLTKHSDEG